MKNGKELRSEIWSWLSDSSRGGELGQLFVIFLARCRLRYRTVKMIESKTARGAAIVLVITLIGYLIQKEEGIPWQETIFENLESIALGSAGLIFLVEIKDRQKRDHYEAWQVINSAQGQSGSGGRVKALEDLCKASVYLDGVAAPRADLSGINLRDSMLRRANFRKATLRKANLQGANLVEANLQEANLNGANLQGARLLFTNLQGADLLRASLRGAILQGADLQGANLSCIELQGASLVEANLRGTILLSADLRDTKGLTQDLLTGENSPLLCNSLLPENLAFEGSQDRDCSKIPAVLAEMSNGGFPSVDMARIFVDAARRTKQRE